MTNNLIQIKYELQCVNAELKANMAAITTEVDALKLNVKDVETSLSLCTDDVVSLKNKFDIPLAQVLTLDGNVRIWRQKLNIIISES